MRPFAWILVPLALVHCAPGPPDSRPDVPLSLEGRLAARLEALPAKSSLYAKHLPSGREVAVRADEPMNTLSVIKIPIMVLAFRDAEAGKLDLDERYRVRARDRRRGSGLIQTFAPDLEPTYRDLVTQMIVTSDNSATDIMIERLGLERVNDLLQDLGYEETRLLVTTGDLFRRVWELQDPANANLSHAEVFDRGFPMTKAPSNGASHSRVRPRNGSVAPLPGKCRDLLEQIHSSEVTSRASSDEMMAILGRQFYSARLRASSASRSPSHTRPVIGRRSPETTWACSSMKEALPWCRSS